MKQSEKKEITFNQALIVYDLNNYLHIDHLALLENSNYKQIEKEMTETYNFYSPEDLTIQSDIENKKEELFNSLSQEAKEIINIIIDCPKELSSICFANNTEKVMIPKLMKLMRKQWKERLIVQKKFKEVFNYANKIKAFNEI